MVYPQGTDDIIPLNTPLPTTTTTTTTTTTNALHTRYAVWYRGFRPGRPSFIFRVEFISMSLLSIYPTEPWLWLQIEFLAQQLNQSLT